MPSILFDYVTGDETEGDVATLAGHLPRTVYHNDGLPLISVPSW